MDLNENLELLCSHSKLERDKGVLEMRSKLLKIKTSDMCFITEPNFQSVLAEFLNNPPNDCRWEDIYGYLQAATILVEEKMCTLDFTNKFQLCALRFLDHTEFRVRIMAGVLLGALCAHVDTNIYLSCEKVLMESICSNLTRGEIIDDTTGNENKNATEIFHNTAGWKNLETSMKGLQAIIEGCKEAFSEYANLDLLTLIFKTLEHTNRFVRETGYYLCAAIARYGVSSRKTANIQMAKELSNHLRIGLADNWSQVRLAASVATRQFLQEMSCDERNPYFQSLLPPMCLNRYYLAEGVKLYSQETWKLILGSEGRTSVETYITDIVDFYIQQIESDNHAVREAACHCMSELGLKINPGVVKPYVSTILDALHVCFRDESWPVRDTACVASSNFILCFPEESKYLVEDLYPLFFANLGDPIPSVRQGAALALTNVAKAYGSDALLVIVEKIRIGLSGIQSQKSISERYEGLDKGLTTYGVIKHNRDNDVDLHSNQQMYSCGSLAPKMNRGGGCMDHSFKRTSEPWEMADGCVYLLGELSHLPAAHSYIINAMDLVVEASRYKHYTHFLHFYETICKVLPVIARGLGKVIFKQYLNNFFDLLFYSVSSESGLTQNAALTSLQAISDYIGINILIGRLEQYNPSYAKTFQDLLPTHSITNSLPM